MNAPFLQTCGQPNISNINNGKRGFTTKPLFCASNRPIIFASGTISLSIESLEKVAYNGGELYVKELHIMKGALL